MSSFTVKRTAKDAFFAGLARGLSGAVCSHSEKSRPEPVRTTIVPVCKAAHSTMDAMRSDWQAVGRDIGLAVHRYGKST